MRVEEARPLVEDVERAELDQPEQLPDILSRELHGGEESLIPGEVGPLQDGSKSAEETDPDRDVGNAQKPEQVVPEELLPQRRFSAVVPANVFVSRGQQWNRESLLL